MCHATSTLFEIMEKMEAFIPGASQDTSTCSLRGTSYGVPLKKQFTQQATKQVPTTVTVDLMVIPSKLVAGIIHRRMRVVSLLEIASCIQGIIILHTSNLFSLCNNVATLFKR